jgi:hypothetical protein
VVLRSEVNERSVTVQLPVTLIEALLKMHATLDAHLAGVLETSVSDGPQSGSKVSPAKISRAVLVPNGKYSAEFLGVAVFASTLPEIFAKVVDMMAEVAPEALDKLSEVRARTRRYVARSPEAIHPRYPGLPVIQAASGWWISRNIGQEDLKRSLHALSDAAGLTFGRDVTCFLQSNAH